MASKVDIASGKKGTISIKIKNADGSEKINLGVVAISDDFPFWKRIPWRIGIWFKYKWYHHVRKVI